MLQSDQTQCISVAKKACRALPHRKENAWHRLRRQLQIETLEDRRVMASLPFGAVETDTAEFMLGRVGVTPVFLESNGELDTSTENWTQTAKDRVYQNIVEGLSFWVDLLATKSSVHTLEWVIDRTFIDDPAETIYEPISRVSNDYTKWVPEFLTGQGFTSGKNLDANMLAFNHSQREKLNTDWAFTIFVVAAENDLNGAFASGGSFSRAFAFSGGLYEVVPSTRPASTFAHETGHIFYARDEYAGGGNYYQRRGYYDAQNTNAVDLNPNQNFQQEVTIMTSGALMEQAYANVQTAAATLAQIGWVDSDSDGIFDVLDVPLELSGYGRFDPAESVYHFVGIASAQALPNRNSSGNGNSITLNKVTQVQYRFAGDSNWIALEQPGVYSKSLDLAIDIQASDVGRTIELRAIDERLGLSSNVFSAPVDASTQTTDRIGLSGVVWSDADRDGIYDIGELPRDNWTVNVTNADGSALNLLDEISIDQLPNGILPVAYFDQFDLRDIGFDSDFSLGVGSGINLSSKTLKPYSVVNSRLLDAWNSSHTLELTGVENFADFAIEVVAGTAGASVRLRAFDASGTLLESYSLSGMTLGQSSVLSVHDSQSRIKRVEIQPLGSSVVELGNFDVGIKTTVTTDAAGYYEIASLPNGNYKVVSAPVADLYSYATPGSGMIDVSYQAGTVSGELNFGPALPENPWINETNPLDANSDTHITVIDVLEVVNAIRQYGVGLLELKGTPLTLLVDVNGDTVLSPLDVLALVNYINANRRSSLGGEGLGEDNLSSTTSTNASFSTPAIELGTMMSPSIAEGEHSPLDYEELSADGVDVLNVAPTHVASSNVLDLAIAASSQGAKTSAARLSDAIFASNFPDLLSNASEFGSF